MATYLIQNSLRTNDGQTWFGRYSIKYIPTYFLK